ncbi:hypothetical protein Tco_1443033 [Tanacetum coccineum]
MQGTSLTKQERECKLYDEFDKFAHVKGESLNSYYLRFAQLINDMNVHKMNLEQFQINTKFLNSLPSEWSIFVTDVKLVMDLHTTNFDQLHAYLQSHEMHANEVRLLRERHQDPLALVANQQTPHHFNNHQSSYNNPLFQQQVSSSQSPQTFKAGISKLTPFTAYNDPPGIIYQDKLKRNWLMRLDELYKFCDGTLTDVRSVLDDIAKNWRMEYLPKRDWSRLDRQRSRIMIKKIDELLFERRLYRNLERFVGGREYGNDFRLLERTI